MHDLRPEVVSFTFGLPTIDECRRLKSAGIVPVATVTTVEEAQMALACGAQALVAQGPSAGGHRGTFDPVALPPREPLEDLLAALVSRFDEPVVAAGGLATCHHVNRLNQIWLMCQGVTEPCAPFSMWKALGRSPIKGGGRAVLHPRPITKIDEETGEKKLVAMRFKITAACRVSVRVAKSQS